jgi:hypothetical protein
MKNLIILDYEHLDNGPFLKSLAKILGEVSLEPCLFLHGGSEYTERIMQLGMMREDAEIRAIKELNHRLASLFGDEGISIVALNGYQRDLIKSDDQNNITIDTAYLKKISGKTHMLLSCLSTTQAKKIKPVDTLKLTEKLASELDIENIYIFSDSILNPVLSDNEQSIANQKTDFTKFKDKVKVLGSNFLLTGRLF